MPYKDPEQRRLNGIRYRQLHKASIAKRKSEYQQRTRTARIEYMKAWRAANADDQKLKRKVYRKNNEDKVKAQKRAYYAKNASGVKARAAQYRAKHRERLASISRARHYINHNANLVRNREYRLNNREKLLATKYLKAYGITHTDSESVFKQQLECCAICSARFEGLYTKQTVRDHDHVTGNFRGFLCHTTTWKPGVSCNLLRPKKRTGSSGRTGQRARLTVTLF